MSDVVFGLFSFNVFVFSTCSFGVGLVLCVLLDPVSEHLTLAWAGCEQFRVSFNRSVSLNPRRYLCNTFP